jgi:hypothetical protein
MFQPWDGQLIYSSTNLPSLSIIFPSFFHNISNVVYTTTPFTCRYLLMRVHTSHWPYGYPPLTLHPWQRTHVNSWWNSWHFCHYCVRCWISRGIKITTCTSFNHIQFLLLTNWHCADQRWNLHPSWHCHCQPNMSGFISLIFCNLWICYLRCNSSQKKKLLQLTPC